MMRRQAMSSTAGSSRVDAVRPGALPRSRMQSGSRRTSPPTSSSSTSPRPGAGSTRCTCSSTALFDRPPFQNCIAHGVVLGDDGRKMSKHLGNYPDPDMVFALWGRRRHALVPVVLVHPSRPGPRRPRRGFEDAVRQVLNPIWNTWYFLSLYGNVDEMRGEPAPIRRACSTATCSPRRLRSSTDVTASMDAYDLFGGVRVDRLVPGRTHQLVRETQP